MNAEEYKAIYEAHKNVFGDTFDKAFHNNEQAKELLTVALLYISRQDAGNAKPMLDMLESIAENAFDEASVWYFRGLSYELLGDDEQMAEYYGKVLNSGVNLSVSLVYSPYYRSAKLNQKASKPKKAVYYFSKALEFFEGRNVTPATAKAVSQMLYDAATVYLYMHDYENCDKFLKLSYDYSNAENPQRDYVKAISASLKGNAQQCNHIIQNIGNIALKTSCINITQAILNGTDLHYCEVPQDRDNFEEFLKGFSENESILRNQIVLNNAETVEKTLSGVLSATFDYVNRLIECKITTARDIITVNCKNYYIRTLKKEQKALFSQISEKFPNWKFISVDE